MTLDAWGKLWDIATDSYALGEGSDPATIMPTDDVGEVVLVWPDGERATVYWHEGDWRFCEPLDKAPCDVAARDTL